MDAELPSAFKALVADDVISTAKGPILVFRAAPAPGDRATPGAPPIIRACSSLTHVCCALTLCARSGLDMVCYHSWRVVICCAVGGIAAWGRPLNI